MHHTWRTALTNSFGATKIKQLRDTIKEQRKHYQIFPAHNVLAALSVPLPNVRVVVLGQDPYHTPGLANGYAFAVPEGVGNPPSLINVYRELATDLPSFCIWGPRLAQQGVLLYNTALTVQRGKPLSHTELWREFSHHVVRIVAQQPQPVAWLLWGKHAQATYSYASSTVSNPHHLVLQASHPSPFSADRGFLGCKHFSKTNNWLQNQQQTPIVW